MENKHNFHAGPEGRAQVLHGPPGLRPAQPDALPVPPLGRRGEGTDDVALRLLPVLFEDGRRRPGEIPQLAAPQNEVLPTPGFIGGLNGQGGPAGVGVAFDAAKEEKFAQALAEYRHYRNSAAVQAIHAQMPAGFNAACDTAEGEGFVKALTEHLNPPANQEGTGVGEVPQESGHDPLAPPPPIEGEEKDEEEEDEEEAREMADLADEIAAMPDDSMITTDDASELL